MSHSRDRPNNRPRKCEGEKAPQSAIWPPVCILRSTAKSLSGSPEINPVQELWSDFRKDFVLEWHQGAAGMLRFERMRLRRRAPEERKWLATCHSILPENSRFSQGSKVSQNS
jgi:hypothetical protein